MKLVVIKVILSQDATGFWIEFTKYCFFWIVFFGLFFWIFFWIFLFYFLFF